MRCTFTATLAVLSFAAAPASALAQELLWSTAQSKDDAPFPHLTDFDGNGSPEIVFNNHKDGRFFVRDVATGTDLFKASAWAWVTDIADFDGDGVEDLLTGNAAFTYDVVSGADFSVLHTFDPIGITGGNGFLLVPDVTGDGLADLVVFVAAPGLAAFASEDDHQIWGYSCWHGIDAPFVIGDVDGDGAVELFAESPQCDKLSAISSRDGSVVVDYINRPGTLYADEDGDGVPDLLFQQFPDFQIRSSATGAVLRSAAWDPNLWTWRPAGDVDGDGVVDLLAGDARTGLSVFVAGFDLQTFLYQWSPALEPGFVTPLQGNRRFDGDRFDDVLLLAYNNGVPVETQIRGGNDFWIYVRQTIDSSAGTEHVDVGLGHGTAGKPEALAVVGVNGTPVFTIVQFGKLDANGFQAFDTDVDPSLFGTSVSLQAFAIGANGRLQISAGLPVDL
jgi:hypothetical protein